MKKEIREDNVPLEKSQAAYVKDVHRLDESLQNDMNYLLPMLKSQVNYHRKVEEIYAIKYKLSNYERELACKYEYLIDELLREYIHPDQIKNKPNELNMPTCQHKDGVEIAPRG